ncbi:uncharacterized protein LOC134825461 [Bolinopsis microptera]|uniref:uncharacterized protein LOC134825461 n=1 Tax=Bolinopsis microptera TaxID=2820187 RepID=UPI003079B72A
MKTYYNGTLIGSKNVSSAPLEEGGHLILGHTYDYRHTHAFGGQLMKLNIFGKVLSQGEITELYNAGRCSDVEKKHQVRYITWEKILSLRRSGRVTEVDSGCAAEEEEEEEEEEEKGEEKDDNECTDSILDILYDQTYFNQTLTAEKLAKVKYVWKMMDRFVGSMISSMPVEEDDSS